MLKIVVEPLDYYNDSTAEFLHTEETTLLLEHSLAAISKWESKWKKSFLSNMSPTITEIKDYVRCMTVGEEADPLVYMSLRPNTIEQIMQYINDPMTATWFTSRKNSYKKPVSGKNDVITSELIYYWMVCAQIPFEAENWHLNRLLTLIRIYGIKNQPSKNNKMSKRDILRQNAAINAARRAKSGS